MYKYALSGILNKNILETQALRSFLENDISIVWLSRLRESVASKVSN